MIHEAGLVSFLRTIVILLVVFYGARLFFRFLVPLFLKRFIKNQQKKYASSSSDSAHYKREEGEVHIKTKHKQKDDKPPLGDYVEFEDIQEK